MKINEEWYMLDVIWASGHVDKKVMEFTKKFDERYFLPDPEEIANTHFEKTK